MEVDDFCFALNITCDTSNPTVASPRFWVARVEQAQGVRGYRLRWYREVKPGSRLYRRTNSCFTERAESLTHLTHIRWDAQNNGWLASFPLLLDSAAGSATTSSKARSRKRPRAGSEDDQSTSSDSNTDFSRYMGVRREPDGRGWSAHLTVPLDPSLSVELTEGLGGGGVAIGGGNTHKRKRYLYPTQLAAAKACDRAALEQWGEDALCNVRTSVVRWYRDGAPRRDRLGKSLGKLLPKSAAERVLAAGCKRLTSAAGDNKGSSVAADGSATSTDSSSATSTRRDKRARRNRDRARDDESAEDVTTSVPVEGPPAADDDAASLALALALSGGYAEPVRRSGRGAGLRATAAIKVAQSTDPAAAILHEGDYLNDKAPKQAPAPAPAPGEEVKSAVAEGNDIAASVLVIREFLSEAAQRPAATWCGPGSGTATSSGSALASMPSDASSHDVTDGRNARQSDRRRARSLSSSFTELSESAAASAQALSQSSRVTRSNRSSRAAGDESGDEIESTSKDRRRSSPRRRIREKERETGFEMASAPRRGPGRPRRSESANSWSQDSESAELLTRRDILKEDDTGNELSPRTQAAVEAAARGNGSPSVRRPSRAAAAAGEEKRREKRGRYGERLEDEEGTAVISEEVTAKVRGEGARRERKRERELTSGPASTGSEQSQKVESAPHFRGVRRLGPNRWLARITLGGSQRQLGHFRTEEAAAWAYDAAALRHHGPKARTNFPHKAHDAQSATRAAQRASQAAQAAQAAATGTADAAIAPAGTTSSKPARAAPVSGISVASRIGRGGNLSRETQIASTQPGQQRRYRGTRQLPDGQWSAYIGVRGHQKTLGKYRTPEEAGAAYDEAALEFHGERAIVNFESSVAQYRAQLLHEGGPGGEVGQGGLRDGTHAESSSRRRSGRLAAGPDSDSTDAPRPRGRPRVQVPNRGSGEDSPRTDRSPARSTGYRSSPSSNETPMLSRLEAAVLAKSLAAFGTAVEPWPYQLLREEYNQNRHGKAFPVGEMIMDAGLNGGGTGTVGAAGTGVGLASIETAEVTRRAAAAAVSAAAEASAEHALHNCLDESHNGRSAQRTEAHKAAAAARLRTARLMEQAAVAGWRGISLLPNASITALTNFYSMKRGLDDVKVEGQELWLASVNAYGREYQVGVFRTAMDAARAHDVVARLLFGARARLNYPWSHYDFLDSHLHMQVNDERRRVRAALKKAVTAAGGSAARLGSLAVISSPSAVAQSNTSSAAEKASVHDPFYWRGSNAVADIAVAPYDPFYWCRVAKAQIQQRPACLTTPDWAKEIVARVESAAPPFPSTALPDRNVPAGQPDSLDIAAGVMRWPRHGVRYQACVKPLVAPPPAARNVAPDDACYVSTTAAAAAAASAPPNSCVLIRGAQWRREHRATSSHASTKVLSAGHARSDASGNRNATITTDENRVVSSVIDEIVGDVAGELKKEQKLPLGQVSNAVPLSPASSVVSTGTDEEEEISAAGCEVAKDALRLEWPAQWRAAFAQALQNNGKHFDRIAADLNADERLAPINVAVGGVGGAPAGPRRSERGGNRAASYDEPGNRRQPTPSKIARRLGNSASGNNKDRTKKTVQQCIVFYYLFFKGSREYHRWKAARAQALRDGAEVPGGTQYGWQQSTLQEPLPPLPATVAVTSFEAASAEANATDTRCRSSASTSRSSSMPAPSPTTSAVAARAALSGNGAKTDPRAAHDAVVEPSRAEREREQRRRQQQERDEEAADEAEEKDAIRSVVREMRLPLSLDDTEATDPDEGRGKFVFGDGLGARYTQAKLKAGEDAYCVCEGIGEGWMVACCFGSQCCGHEWYHGVCVGLTKVDLEHNPDFACSACCIAVAAGKLTPPASTIKSAGANKAVELLVAAGRARSPALLYRNAIAKGDGSSRPGRRGGARRRKQAAEKRAKALAEARARGVSLNLRRTDALMQQWERDEQQQAAVPFGGRAIPIDPMQLDLGLPPEKQPAAVQAVRIAKVNAAKQARAAVASAKPATSAPIAAAAVAARPKYESAGSRQTLAFACHALPNSQAIMDRSVPSNAIEWQKRAVFAPPSQRPKPSSSPVGAPPETPTSAPMSVSAPASHGPSPVESQPPTPATPNTEALATYAVGDTVEVQSRTWPGINKPGGAGRVVNVNADGTYFIKYVLGGFEKRVEEKYIRPLVPYRSSTPSSAGANSVTTPSSSGAVARGTPSPPVGATDEVSPEELLSAAGIGPHWLPPLADRRVPLWDETEGLVIIAQNAPKVPEVEEALRRSRLLCRAGDEPLVPFFGALSELAPGGYGPGAGPFAKLYAPSRSRQRKARGRPSKRDNGSGASTERARDNVGVLAATSADGVKTEDNCSKSWSRPTPSQLLTGMKCRARDEGSDEEDEEMEDGHVGSISGRRRGIRGSRMHDVPVVNRERKGIKRRRACRRVRRFVRSLPEVIEGIAHAQHVAQQNGVDMVKSDVDESDEDEGANAPSWAPRRGAAALREREIEAQAQAHAHIKVSQEPVNNESRGPSKHLKRPLDEVSTDVAAGADTDAKRPRLQVSPSKNSSTAEPFSPLSPSALAAAEHERLRVQHEAQRVRCAERAAQAEARHLERTAKAQEASEQRQRLQAQALSAARDAQMALERHRIAMQEAAAARQLAESLTPRASNEQQQMGSKEPVVAMSTADAQSQTPSVHGTPPPPAAPK